MILTESEVICLATALIRTILLYIALIVGLRAMGKRQIGELEPIELVMTMLVSDLAAVPMQDFGIPLLNGIVPILTLLSLSMLLSFCSMHSIRIRRFICGNPTTLIRNGVIQQDALLRNRFTLDELIDELRAQGVTDLSTVKYAVLETNGSLSVLLYTAEQSVTPKQLGLAIEDEQFLPDILINDGRVLSKTLRNCGLDEAWLHNTLNAQGYHSAREVLLLSRDQSGKLLCIGRDGKI